jgi:hypothetical protein
MAMRQNLQIRLDDREALRLLGRLAEKLRRHGKFEEAISMGLNEAISTCTTEAIKAIREEFAVSRTEVRNTLRVWKASRQKLRAELVGRGRMSVELIHYDAAKTRKGVSVKVLKSSKRSIIPAGGEMGILETQKRKRPRTWIAKGHVLAMTGKEKNPIRMLWGPSFLSRLSNDDIRARVLQTGVAKFEKRIKTIGKYLLDKA